MTNDDGERRPIFMLIECPACGFDAVKKANGLTLDYCPLCAEDNGRDQVMVERRQATADDNVEGRNALKEHRATHPNMETEMNTYNDKQIDHMVNRFLAWRLPADFAPDGGVSFKATFNDHLPTPMQHDPSGTNLLNYTQAEAMVRHMLEGLPTPSENTDGR